MNSDILNIIADYIEPNPFTYCKLMTVNRTFYKVFTSNRAWRYLNPHGHKGNIYLHFRKSLGKKPEIKNYWTMKMLQPRVTDDLYCWLGYLVSGTCPPIWLSGDPRDQFQLVWCAVSINCRALLWASEKLQDNREVVLSALLNVHDQNTKVIHFISKRLSKDHEIASLYNQIWGIKVTA